MRELADTQINLLNRSVNVFTLLESWFQGIIIEIDIDPIVGGIYLQLKM